MSGTRQNIQSIAIIGAGIIGLACALELADRGLRVSLYDKSWPPRGASWAAAGMLAPAFEAASVPGVHPQLFHLCDRSAQMWPGWAKALETRTGLSAGYRAGPSLAVATNPAQARALKAIAEVMQNHPNAPQACSVDQARMANSLSEAVTLALLLPSDGQADNRRTMAALITAIESHANVSIHATVAPLQTTGQQLDHAGHDATLVCAGWGTALVNAEQTGRPFELSVLEPVLNEIDCYGGQMLSVAPIAGGPQTTIRCGDLYIVPKQDRIVIGATTEPGRVLEAPEPEVIADLKARAAEICPVLADAEILESWAGVRPGTADHAPILGALQTPGLFVASGHFRNGILLAPITAQIIADLIVESRTTDLARAFSPDARATVRV